MAEQNSSISNFREFLLRVLLPLFFIFSGAGFVFNYFFEKEIILKSPICGAYKVNRIITETHPQEIPIFGSSRAGGGFIPDSLGSDLFNYGLSGTNYDVALFFLKQECRKIKTTPWIILNFDLDGMTYGRGDIGNYILNANNPEIEALLGADYRGYFSVPFIKYYGRYENYFGLFLSDRIELTKITNKGASLEKNRLPQKEFNDLVSERKNTSHTFRNDPVLEQRLLHIMNTNSNRQFIFVIAPYHTSYFQGYTNQAPEQAFLDTLRSFKNAKVFDFSKLPLADSMFLNTTHINYKGAVIFNHLLRDSLKALGAD